MQTSIHETVSEGYRSYRHLRQLDEPLRSGDSPIDFADFALDPHFYQLESHIVSPLWRLRIVGLTPQGLLYLDSRKSKFGYYLYQVRAAAWNEIREVSLLRRTSSFGMVWGVASLLLGLAGIVAIIVGFITGVFTSFKDLAGLGLPIFLTLALLAFGSFMCLSSWRSFRINAVTEKRALFLDLRNDEFPHYVWFYKLVQRYCGEHEIPVAAMPEVPRTTTSFDTPSVDNDPGL